MVTINWDKIWEEYYDWLYKTDISTRQKKQNKIVELVEKELADWFVRSGLNGCCG